MIISKTPLRISFVGGGTDIDTYYKTGYGAVVNAAINKYIYVTVHKRFDSSIRIGYTNTEIIGSADEVKHDIVRACLQMAGIKNGVEITTIGEVPAGTGMGSSSALTVGLLNALFTYKGVRLSAQELMDKACEVEIEILKHPIGKQDQASAAFGGLNYFRFNADNSIEHNRIELSPAEFTKLERRLILLYTGITHSADQILSEQKEKTASKQETLNFMRDQADTMHRMLKSEGFTPHFGEMLRSGWEKKRSITSLISNCRIDELYNRALEAGAIGGKLLGAGGGGFLLFYCEEEKQDALREALGLQQMLFRIARYGSRVVYFE